MSSFFKRTVELVHYASRHYPYPYQFNCHPTTWINSHEYPISHTWSGGILLSTVPCLRASIHLSFRWFFARAPTDGNVNNSTCTSGCELVMATFGLSSSWVSLRVSHRAATNPPRICSRCQEMAGGTEISIIR